MTVTITFVPLNQALKEGKHDLYARIKYRMFPELEGEFNRNDYMFDKDMLVPNEKIEEKRDGKG